MKINSSVLEKLEYDRVLNHISNYVITDSARKYVLGLKPSKEPDRIKLTGNRITQAKNILIEQVPPPIDYLPELSNDLAQSRIEGAIIPAKRILYFLMLARTSRLLFKYLKDNIESAPDFRAFTDRLFIDKVFEHHIEKIIDENGEIKETASSKLQDIRKELRDKQSELTKSISRIMKSLESDDMVREDYLTLRDGRMVIPIKAEHKRHMRGFIHSESSTGQTVYIEPEETLELNNSIISLNFAEKREVERLLKELTSLVGKLSTKLEDSYNVITEIDSLFAGAKYSIEILGCFPQIDNSQSFFVKDARHPVLLKKLGRDRTVPLNFKIDDEKIIVITGPNAGGKTVVLKTIGLNLLLLHTGLHIPVNPDSNFRFFNNLILDIGDEQSIENDLSTFSSHLLNIRSMLETADSNSIILIDEIGTGTDPTEGSAMAAAILIKLRDLGALVFATTHHGSLKLVAQNELGFVNAAMEFDHKFLEPTYNFKLGVPGSSYAFEIARRIGIKNDLLKTAESFIDSDKFRIEKFLVELEEKSNSLQHKLREMELENSRLKGLSNLYKLNLEKLEKEKKDILKSAKTEAKNYLQEINKKVESAIKEIRESSASHETIKKAKEIIRTSKLENEKLFTGDVVLVSNSADFNIGNSVSIKGISSPGKIVAVDKQKEKAVVQVGSLKMSIGFDEMTLETKQIENDTKKRTGYKFPQTSYRLDIRGKRTEEINHDIIRFIDDSFVVGNEHVEILHGKGSGALKKLVKEILENHDKVKTFYFAPLESGGEGITIVELK